MHVPNKLKRKKSIAIVLSILIFLLLGYGIMESRKPEPIPNYSISDRSSEVIVVVPVGATGDQIAKILYTSDVVKSARAFFAAATANAQSKSIQPGTYRLDSKIPGREAVNQLLDPKRRIKVLLIREGERLGEIESSLLNLDFNKTDIKNVFEEKNDITGFGMRALEGFAFPATYNLMPNQQLSEVRDMVLNKFNDVISQLDFISRATKIGMDPYSVLIIASIIQAEGFDQRDFSKISRVISNRLAAGMPLQMDSTILYTLKERRIAVNSKDLQITSPFNSYNRKGLPPIPIGNPGAAALEAALAPENGDWLYFVTVEPTVTKFTNSYKEFLAFKQEFKRNLKAGKFGETS